MYSTPVQTYWNRFLKVLLALFLVGGLLPAFVFFNFPLWQFSASPEVIVGWTKDLAMLTLGLCLLHSQRQPLPGWARLFLLAGVVLLGVEMLAYNVGLPSAQALLRSSYGLLVLVLGLLCWLSVVAILVLDVSVRALQRAFPTLLKA